MNSNLTALIVAVLVFALVFLPVSWFFIAAVIVPSVLLAVSAWLSYSTQAHPPRGSKRRD